MSVLFLGPLPPPVHGFSLINAAMLERLKKEGTVHVFDRAPQGAGVVGVVGKLVHWAAQLARFATRIAVSSPHSLYAGMSGGTGQLLDLPFLALARAAGVRTYIHHHSFAYLNEHSRVTAACMRVLRRAQHVALCADMAAALVKRYGIAEERITVLSNAAFLEASARPDALPAAAPGPLGVTVGFLSNITAEKGIFEFLAVLRQAAAAGISWRAEVAGPVDPAIAERFAAEMGSTPNSRHVGAVYAGDKLAFLQRIDLLIFPTRYQNEAEPVTILEALQAGVAVVATTRGCIGGMLPTGCGEAVSADGLAEACVDAMRNMAARTLQERAAQRRTTQASFERLRDLNAKVLAGLVCDISAPAGINA